MTQKSVQKKKKASTRSKTPRKQPKRQQTSRLKLRWLWLLPLTALGIWLFLNAPWEMQRPLPGREIRNGAELQIALARIGFSPGSIDGQPGEQTGRALAAFQNEYSIPESGLLDEMTLSLLKIEDPVFARLVISRSDFEKIGAKPSSWRERETLDRMHFNSMLEYIAEFTQSDPDYIAALNPNTNWAKLRPGQNLNVPHLPAFRTDSPANTIHIALAERTLQLRDAKDRVIFHCPVSIARQVDKRPVGELRVKVRVEAPNYTFNPAILKATAEREGISQKFVIQPGPNNPVGSVWIGLDRPSYGIHGTPEPEKVGRTESSGCFRLANWNAETVLHAVTVGTRVFVSP